MTDIHSLIHLITCYSDLTFDQAQFLPNHIQNLDTMLIDIKEKKVCIHNKANSIIFIS